MVSARLERSSGINCWDITASVHSRHAKTLPNLLTWIRRSSLCATCQLLRFGPELMDAYPDAKIILHPIRSVDSWHHFVLQDTVRRRESTGCTPSCNMSTAVTGLVHSLPCRRRIQAVPLFNDDFRKRNGKNGPCSPTAFEIRKHARATGSEGCWYSDSGDEWGALCEFSGRWRFNFVRIRGRMGEVIGWRRCAGGHGSELRPRRSSSLGCV